MTLPAHQNRSVEPNGHGEASPNFMIPTPTMREFSRIHQTNHAVRQQVSTDLSVATAIYMALGGTPDNSDVLFDGDVARALLAKEIYDAQHDLDERISSWMTVERINYLQGIRKDRIYAGISIRDALQVIAERRELVKEIDAAHESDDPRVIELLAEREEEMLLGCIGCHSAFDIDEIRSCRGLPDFYTDLHRSDQDGRVYWGDKFDPARQFRALVDRTVLARQLGINR